MKDVSFERSIEKLEKIVEELESEDFSLENSLKKYEEGVKLSRICQNELDKAKAKIEILMKKKDGTWESREMESEE
ncbi:MAG: exodeoxyribonuclease VII small subunit [Candidatus Omnitrophica bacterium]|nr:exodeoxyribonuclease VII small subunit [Candidatus Omnitrophota bacterium]